METWCAGSGCFCIGFDMPKATNPMVILSLTCTDTRGNFLSMKEWPASLPWHMSFSSIRMHEEATARHRRVSPLLPGVSTHTAQAALIPGQDHTLLPHGTGSHYALYAVCLLTGEHTQVGFPWKNCMFQSYVLPCTPLPVFLPMHSVWRMGR